MSEDVLMLIAFMAGAVMIAGHVARIVRTNVIHRTIRDAIVAGSPLTGELLDRLDRSPAEASGDDRTGMILIALAAALICYGLIQGGADDVRETAGAALFPLFVGIVLVARDQFMKRKGTQA